MPTNPSIQEKIDIEDIKNGVVILKDKSLRAVLIASSINFKFKSQTEQDALTYAFGGFLNSLDFSVQIVISSRKFNLANYLSMLEAKKKEQENELLRVHLSEYIDFIKGLTELTNIITESFYIVVPFAPIETNKAGPMEKINVLLGWQENKPEEAQKTFDELKTQLWQRINYVVSGLEGMGIRAVPLNTDELIELYYKMYNPEEREKPPILANSH